MVDDNRLTKSDYLIVYSIILAIFFFILGFFIGAKLMKNQIADNPAFFPSNNLNLLENDLRTFNQNILLPAEEIDLLYTNGEQTILNEKINKALSKIEQANLNESKYLKNGKEYFLLSLINLKSLNRKQYITYYNEGRLNFYQALLVWSTKNSQDKWTIPTEYIISNSTWNNLSFFTKLAYIAYIIKISDIHTSIHPEDLIYYINNYIEKNDQNNKLNLQELIKFLINSNAVKKGDFLLHKDFYNTIIKPDISLFNN